ILLFACCMCMLLSQAQTTQRIKYRADMGYYDEDVMPGAQRLIGHVVFSQDNVRGYCDSAYLFERENYIIAYGDKVRILVGDSVRLYGYRVYYNGNTKMVSIASNVRLEKGKAFLLTDSLIYDMNREVGFYITGGTIINDKDTLNSKVGHYYTKTDDAYVSRDVAARNETYTMDCDSMRYNTAQKMVYFISPTQLCSDKQDGYTESGWYDTDKDISLFVGNVWMQEKQRVIKGDSIYYNRFQHVGRAWHNVDVSDNDQNYVLRGNYVEYHDKGGVSTATDSALLILIDKQDSLFLHADTLKLYTDENQDAQLALAYYHSKFYRHDIQGACDSLSCVVTDTIIYLYYNPVVWSDDYQMTADTIYAFKVDSTHSCVKLCKSAFLVGGIYQNTEFNQVKGVNITGFIENKKLYQVDIDNNAECIYYVQEEDSSLIGINTSITSQMRILLEDNKINQIRFYDKPDGKIYPDNQFEDKNRKLADFRWLGKYRPRKPKDLFVFPIPREKGTEELE
ncbi:MAG: hypothetical protein J6S56_02820, partial [Bacteroidales bacterium]|nr:hypothetical protein [Bacteroidales bacterium]